MNRPRTSPWRALAAPLIWALHFLLSYITVAIACARQLPEFDLARTLVALYTLLAFAGIALCAWPARRARGDPGATPAAPREDRRPPAPAAPAASTDREAGGYPRFLSGLTQTLAGLSAVATAYVAMPILFFESCR